MRVLLDVGLLLIRNVSDRDDLSCLNLDTEDRDHLVSGLCPITMSCSVKQSNQLDNLKCSAWEILQ